MIDVIDRLKAAASHFIVSRRNKQDSQVLEEKGLFFHDRSLINKINFKDVVKRIIKSYKDNLLPDPLALKDIEWYINDNEKEFKDLIFYKYAPSQKLTCNMSKKSFSFRPVSYLQPIDSIIYQALVDTIIRYKRDKFSNQVYSNIINKVNLADVFHNPVGHWRDMRDNIRLQFHKGNVFYFTSDVSGYFENIKIEKLIKITEFFTGRNEIPYLVYLKKLLCLWQYADSQGLVQIHNASSILAKIYLSPVDTTLQHLLKKYNRFVDEFHILSQSRPELMKIILELNKALRDIGLNINTSKTKVLEGDDIIDELDEEKDFFDSVNYAELAKRDFTESYNIIKKRFKELETEVKVTRDFNDRVFRYCIRKFKKLHDPIAISFCFDILDTHPGQTVDIVKYLAIFINDMSYHRIIIEKVYAFLKDKDKNLYDWQQIWLLTLLYSTNDKSNIDFKFVNDIANNKNQDDLSRSICYLILAKHLKDYELNNFQDYYHNVVSLTLKRSLLFCLAKLPNTVTKGLFEINEKDNIQVRILKKYLQTNKVDFSNHKII